MDTYTIYICIYGIRIYHIYIYIERERDDTLLYHEENFFDFVLL